MAAVTVCTDAFIPLAHAQSRALGLPDSPVVVMPHPFGNRSREAVRGLAEQCVVEIASVATTSGRKTPPVARPITPGTGLIEVPDEYEGFTRMCRERGWTDGLPLVPPTPERVERMLAGCCRARHETVAVLAPAFGEASVERIAVNAVLAGCDPGVLPVLIAAAEAVADPAFNLQAIQATTNSAAVFLLLNGPIAGRLGVNAGINCLGPGNVANATLGRALRLLLQNIGGARGGDMDRATQGQPGKYTFCCAENEAASPWEPLHVERGFTREDSTVTVIGVSGTLNLNSHSKDADDLVRVLADSLAHPTSNDYWYGGDPWVMLGPEQAAVLHAGGLDKATLKLRLWDQSKLAAHRLTAKDFLRIGHARRAQLGEIGRETMIPITSSPDGVGVIVAGGPGTHSVYLPSFGNTRSVTRRIRLNGPA